MASGKCRNTDVMRPVRLVVAVTSNDELVIITYQGFEAMNERGVQLAEENPDRQVATIEAVDQFLDLLARLIARAHMRKHRNAGSQACESRNSGHQAK